MSDRILLAGCGDLGQRVATQLLRRGHDVFALRRQPPPDGHSGMNWLRADLSCMASLAALPDGLTHLVYLPTPDAREESAYRTVFITGLRHLLSAMDTTRLGRVLLVSSSAVYGEHGGAWVNEETPPSPLGFNGRVLLQAESDLHQQAIGKLWLPVVLRLAGLYGPGRTHLIERLRRGIVTVPRQVPHWSNLIHVEDAASAIVHLLHHTSPASLYLGVDDTPLPLHERYDALASLLGVASPAVGPPPVNVGSKRLCNAHLRASGFVPCWPDARAGYAALLHDECVTTTA